MLSYRTVEPHTLELLKAISAKVKERDIRLVGGTALALQFGHRQSVDLDFFGKIDSTSDELRDMLQDIGVTRVHKESTNIKIYDVDNIKIDFVNYKYDWIDRAVEEDGILLASPVDIAAMKINAVEGRGTKKDFIDVNELLKHYTLEEILNFYTLKYPEHSIFRALLSLTYFEDAESQLMPKMFVEDSWEVMKARISDEVKKLTGNR